MSTSDQAVNNFMGRAVASAILGYILYWVVMIVLRFTLPIAVSNVLYMHPFIPWVACSVVVWFLLRNFKMPFQPGTPPPAFKVAFKDKNLALDTENDQLWIVPMTGKPMVLKRDDILGWDHLWVDGHNAYGMLFKVKNQLRFRLNSLERPVATVNFGRANQSAQEWHARLTKWLNH